ncbi:MAG: hypothetical protein CMQ20_16415 [Gammaproteobacteria bacterium]|jgi:hypothetical protein|nr:hypothetical protein [Gammaproteobacteria bacterium]|tara:strand:- start:184 stop:684 length:501 start_codon:yes stop_codon:yes gene_type:complete
MDEQLQQLLDKQAISEVIQRYCRTMDWLDEPGQADCYWPDAEVDFGFFAGRADAFVPMVMEHERNAVKRWHLQTGVMIKVDGDKAQAESYGITTGSGGAGGPSTMYGGRYLDDFEKRNGEWRLSKRLYILDWTKTYEDISEVSKLEGGSMHTPNISAAGHELYREM